MKINVSDTVGQLFRCPPKVPQNAVLNFIRHKMYSIELNTRLN